MFIALIGKFRFCRFQIPALRLSSAISSTIAIVVTLWVFGCPVRPCGTVRYSMWRWKWKIWNLSCSFKLWNVELFWIFREMFKSRLSMEKQINCRLNLSRFSGLFEIFVIEYFFEQIWNTQVEHLVFSSIRAILLRMLFWVFFLRCCVHNTEYNFERELYVQNLVLSPVWAVFLISVSGVVFS